MEPDCTRNVITGTCDPNDFTVYTGYADMPAANIATWKIWYVDNTTYSKADGTIGNAPNKLVAFGIIKKTNGKYMFIEGHEYYFFDSGVCGYTNNLSEAHGKILMGGWLSDEDYKNMVLTALADPNTK